MDNKDKKKNLFSRLSQGLAKTRSSLVGRLDNLILGKKEIDEDLLEEIEEILFTSDLGVAASQEIIDLVRDSVTRKEMDDPEKIKNTLKENIIRFLDVEKAEEATPERGEPLVVMVIGVNGVGKTTTIGKAANLYKEQGKKVMMVAADTFRAAATEQLEVWGKRVGVEVIRQKHGADPSAVVFDAIDAAMSRNVDVVLIDTAGRLHTKVNLMDELEKMYRVIRGKLRNAPHEIWLVLDSTTGQNAIAQAEMFHKSLGITGIVLTKLDGTAKGGIVVGITHQLGIPVKFIGIGEKMDDLRPFDAEDFVEAIFAS